MEGKKKKESNARRHWFPRNPCTAITRREKKKSRLTGRHTIGLLGREKNKGEGWGTGGLARMSSSLKGGKNKKKSAVGIHDGEPTGEKQRRREAWSR